MDLRTLKKITAHCIKHGLLVYKTNEVELHFQARPLPVKQIRKSKTKSSVQTEYIPTDGLTDEEILNWSVRSELNG